jgi:hypothetical protein
MPVIPGTLEAEAGRLKVGGQPLQYPGSKFKEQKYF